MSKECSNAPKLDVIQKFETEPVSFIAKADLPSIFGKFTVYGFLEKVYENALMILLEQEGINAVQQAPISVYFEEQIVGEYFADILIDEKIIVEIKAAEKIIPAHEAQALNYLKATKLRLALILNFGKEKMEQERLVI